MKIYNYLLTSFILMYSISSIATSSDSTKSKVTISGYVDVYYGFDFSNPGSHERPSFLYNYTRHNEFNLNLGYIKANYSSERVRANLALMAGTYAQYNLASEQGLLKNIFEANAGIKLSRNRNLWVDAGVFASHIGLEGAVSKDCWTLTRSLSAENTPYYLSGAKLTYISNNDKWNISGAVINGWQHIRRPDGNNSPAFGTQVAFKPTSKITLNSSTFIGNDKPDSSAQMRYFHDLYGTFQVTNKWGIYALFDIGAEQKSKGSDEYNVWFNPTVITRYAFTNKFTIAARAEYYHDPNSVIITTATPSGFQTFGYSLNADYAPVSQVLLRIEGRMFNSKDAIFSKGSSQVNQNYSIFSSIAVSF